MRRLWALLVLFPMSAAAADYLTIDDTTKSFLSEIVGCSGGSNAVTYNIATHTFGCNSIGGGPGGTNTASNLGGGLANYDSASGTDLRFNTFWATDFDLAANLFKIDDTKWATDAQVATAVAASAPFVHVTASADLAAPAGLTGADITAAIAACPASVPCQVDLIAGTYTNTCVAVSRDDTHIIGRGVGITIMNPYVDLDDCLVTDDGNMIQNVGADNFEMGYMELDGKKQFLTVPTCDVGFCGNAILQADPGNNLASHGHLHHLYIHDFAGTGIGTTHADYWIVEDSVVDNLGCNQATANTCGCGAGDPGDCRGWDLEPDLGLGLRTQANILTFANSTNNSVARRNTFGVATHGGIEVAAFGGSCAAPGLDCADNNTFEDNDVGYSLLVNGGQHVKILRNRIHNVGVPGGTGDVGVGVLVTANNTYDVLIRDNLIYDNASSGIVIKPGPSGDITIDHNVLYNNCTDHADNGNIWIWSQGASASRDLLVSNNRVGNSGGCTYALLSEASAGFLFAGSVQFIGGHYETGSSGTVKIDNANVLVRGLEVVGDLEFGATAHGMAMGNDVSGSTTNTGGVCIMENDSTPIPSTCVNP